MYPSLGVQVFDSDGKFLIKSRAPPETRYGQFSIPQGEHIAVDSNDRVYMLGGHHPRVQILDTEGQFLTNDGISGRVS